MGNKTQKLSNVVDQIVEWQAVVTADGSTGLTAVAGRGYFIDTTSGAITVTLPASPKIGDTITITDYASTFNTNNVTINPNGNKIEASTTNGVLSTNDQTHTLVFTDSTQGWKIVNQDTASGIQPTFIAATGGTITTSGDFKIHSFTGDGCFVVSAIGNPAGSTAVDYLVVAGGGGGGGTAATGNQQSGGGGAGGLRTTFPSPGSNAGAFPIAVQTYPITVGSGGTGGPICNGGSNGNNSVFSTITSTGGGGGGVGSNPGTGRNGNSGGSGGGAGGTDAPDGIGGSGNTPPTSPPQGNPGANGTQPANRGGSGGGATAAGSTPPSNAVSAPGGAGLTSLIDGSPVTRAVGGATKGGAGSGCSASANTGGGGQGAYNDVGGAGGSGIVIIRYKFQ
jgi:hypothetical protein